MKSNNYVTQIMKSNTVKGLALLVAVAGMTANVHAIPIPNGSEVDMSGTATLDSTFLGLATKATAFSAVTVGGTPSGGYSLVPTGTAVTWSPFGWNPASLPSPLWTFTVPPGPGAGTYTFTLSTVTIVTQNNTFLNLSGTGVATAPGFDPTGGSWTLSISNPSGGAHQNSQFTFQNSQVTVPDGGVTAMLLGSALSVLGLIRRKLA
jgi:hypothetical protein